MISYKQLDTIKRKGIEIVTEFKKLTNQCTGCIHELFIGLPNRISDIGHPLSNTCHVFERFYQLLRHYLNGSYIVTNKLFEQFWLKKWLDLTLHLNNIPNNMKSLLKKFEQQIEIKDSRNVILDLNEFQEYYKLENFGYPKKDVIIKITESFILKDKNGLRIFSQKYPFKKKRNSSICSFYDINDNNKINIGILDRILEIETNLSIYKIAIISEFKQIGYLCDSELLLVEKNPSSYNVINCQQIQYLFSFICSSSKEIFYNKMKYQLSNNDNSIKTTCEFNYCYNPLWLFPITSFNFIEDDSDEDEIDESDI